MMETEEQTVSWEAQASPSFTPSIHETASIRDDGQLRLTVSALAAHCSMETGAHTPSDQPGHRPGKGHPKTEEEPSVVLWAQGGDLGLSV